MLWIALGVVGLAGLGLLLMKFFILAGVFPLAAAMMGVGTQIYRQSGEQKGPPLNGKRYGRGPYTAVVCSPSAEFARHLGETLRELREAAAQADLEVDAGGLNVMLDRAAAAKQSGDYAQAVRSYCQGIGFLLAEFKRQGKSRPGGTRR